MKDAPSSAGSGPEGSGPDHSLLVREVASASQLFQAAAGVRAGLTPTELAVLTLLRGAPHTAGQLSETTQLTTGAITRVLDGLEQRGYVTRGSDPADRRRVVVSLLPDRAATVDAVFAPMVAAAETVAASFTPAELATAGRYLTAVTAMLREQTAVLRDGSGPVTSATLEAALGGVRHARLHLAGRVERLDVVARAGDPAPGGGSVALYRGHFEGSAPTVEVGVRDDEGEVRMRFGRRTGSRWRPGHRVSSIELAPEADWAIEVHGGAQQLFVDVSALDLRSFSLRGGAQEIRLRLAAPRGVVRLALTGGAQRLRIERPAGLPVDLRVRGGASNVVVDGERQPPLSYPTHPWQVTDPDRYELSVTGGVSNLDIAPAAP